MFNFDRLSLGGLLVCEVAVQEPFLYTKVYALETYRFLNSNTMGLHPNSESAQAHYTFLNECDHIKVILFFNDLHSSLKKLSYLSFRETTTYCYCYYYSRCFFTCIRSPTTSTCVA